MFLRTADFSNGVVLLYPDLQRHTQLSSYSLSRVLSLGISRYHTYKPLFSAIFLLERKVKKEKNCAITFEIAYLFYLTTWMQRKKRSIPYKQIPVENTIAQRPIR